MSAFYSVSKVFLKNFFSLLYSHEIYLPEHDLENKGAIIAANHCSFFDPPLVAVSWPEQIHFLAWKPLFKNPILRSLLHGLHAFPIDGINDISSLRAAFSILTQGEKLLIFPEGSRSEDGEFLRFMPGAAMLACRTGAPIIPCYIHGTDKIWPKNQVLPWPLGGCKTACVFGLPVYSENFGTSRNAQAAMMEYVQQEVLRLKREYTGM
jgi:1-acyl-sn-glycerol-3-phosphate acyltransferase